MDGRRFDTFAKALGAGVVGVLFARAGPEQARADPGDPGTHGNSACAHFCAAVFGADTPAAGQCTSDAAHGTGLCHTCGASTEPSSICCTRNASGFCVSYSGVVCCANGQTCCSGTCKNLTNDVNNCGSCGNTCPAAPPNATAVCANAKCTTTCNFGSIVCNGTSVCTPCRPWSGNRCNVNVLQSGCDVLAEDGTCEYALLMCPTGQTCNPATGLCS
jgi:hypothetical protein